MKKNEPKKFSKLRTNTFKKPLKNKSQPSPRLSRRPKTEPLKAIEKEAKPQRQPPSQLGKRAARAEADRRFIWGKHPVQSYLEGFKTTLTSASEKVLPKALALFVIVDKQGNVPPQLEKIEELCLETGTPLKKCRSAEDDEWPVTGPSINHQRVALWVEDFPTTSIEEVLKVVKKAVSDGVNGCIGVVLDQVQDPRNFGAIMRSSAFFGQKFVVFAQDRQAALTASAIKASAGGAFCLDLCSTVNISRCLDRIKDAGAWIVGASTEGTIEPTDVPLDRSYVLVVGNEEQGLRREVSNRCDYSVSIPQSEGLGRTLVDSLNVGVAAGICLAALRPRSKK